MLSPEGNAGIAGLSLMVISVPLSVPAMPGLVDITLNLYAFPFVAVRGIIE